MIETVLEQQINGYENVTGTLTTAIGSNNAVGITDCAAGDIIYWVDDAGNARSMVLTAANTFLKNAISVATGVTAYKMSSSNINFHYFIVDTTKIKTRIFMPLNVGVGRLTTGPDIFGGYYKFNKNEGVLLKSLYYRLPYQFTMADAGVSILLNVSTDATTQPYILGFAPLENSEIPFNFYVPPNTTGVNNYYELSTYMQNAADIINNAQYSPAINVPQVSMVNVPTELNYNVLPVIIGARIVHSLDMIV
jgi:hypothetical protein